MDAKEKRVLFVTPKKKADLHEPVVTAQKKQLSAKKTIDQLAEEQNVKPIKDISELFGDWPKNADFDSFYNTAVNSRKHAGNE